MNNWEYLRDHYAIQAREQLLWTMKDMKQVVDIFNIAGAYIKSVTFKAIFLELWLSFIPTIGTVVNWK